MGTNLPYLQSDDEILNRLQNLWRAILNPLISIPMLNGGKITASLKTGENQIPHLLSRTQQGWVMTDRDGVASVYRSRPFTSTNLYLTASAPVNVALWVY